MIQETVSSEIFMKGVFCSTYSVEKKLGWCLNKYDAKNYSKYDKHYALN